MVLKGRTAFDQRGWWTSQKACLEGLVPADMRRQEVWSRPLSKKLDQHLKQTSESAKLAGALGRRAWRSRKKNKRVERVAE